MSDWQQISLGVLETPVRGKVVVPPQGSRASVSDGYPLRPLGEMMYLDIQRTPMKHATTYRLAGVLNAGKGVVAKGELDGGDTEYAAMNVLRADQVVMRKLTAWEGPITVVPAEFDGFVVSNEFPTYTLGPELLPAWMRHVCGSPRLWAEMKNRVSGTVQRRKRLNPEQLLQIQLPIPPREVQVRIVEILDAVDDQIAALHAESAALEGLLESLRSDLPETDHQPIGDVLLGIDSGKSVQAGGEASAEDEYRILKLSAVQCGWFKPSEAKTVTEVAAFSPGHVVKNGDLLITRANTPERVGFVAIARNVPEGTFMPDLIWRLRVDESRVRTGYLEHALSSRELRTSISGTAGGTSKSMVKINKRGFGAVRVPIPSLPEQGEYVQRCDAVAEGIRATRAEEARLRQARSGLLSGLLDRTIEIESVDLGG
ncbi:MULTISPECIES: restriction endonuclease subunit S [Streptomyces violaceusniger group]|uniref:Restriction endonuclease subunit S n=1 Tax=Streptomyces antimycoticus TaxID=68175 RepID=A0ABD5JL38_9ACTN|nr:restriction endonuclease subunit S [Streptomyces violaceusniger]MEE4589153.1 restriction endonuclease subunit S [Streptomyces sp. DSM 41602]